MKRKLLAGIAAWLLLSVAVLPVSAHQSSIPVTVDDVLLSGTSYLENGTTTAPLRELCNCLGGWKVYWNSDSQSAVAEKSGQTIVAKPGNASLYVNGKTCFCPAKVSIKNGHTYVPLRTICEALGFQVSWNHDLDGAAVNTGKVRSYNNTDLYWLSHIISAESQGEPLRGQIAVGNVVLNRVAFKEFPNTIKGVIFDTKDGVQFEPVSNNTINSTPTPRSVIAAKATLAGTKIVSNCLYFFDPALSSGTWIRTHRTYFTTIGCHRFYH